MASGGIIEADNKKKHTLKMSKSHIFPMALKYGGKKP